MANVKLLYNTMPSKALTTHPSLDGRGMEIVPRPALPLSLFFPSPSKSPRRFKLMIMGSLFLSPVPYTHHHLSPVL
jgi:hypothetical protein